MLLITISPPDHCPRVFPSSFLNLILPAFFNSLIVLTSFFPSAVLAKALLATICIAVGDFFGPLGGPAAPVSATTGAPGAEGEGAPASPMITVKQPRTMTPP